MSPIRFMYMAGLHVIVLVLQACSSPSLPLNIPQPGKTAITSRSPQELLPLSDFPLTPGSYWVYSHIEYWEDQVNSGRITVSVVESQMLASHFLAHLTVESSFEAQWTPEGLGQGASDFWYALDEQGHVYYLRDFPQAEHIPDSVLAYQFPLESTECWFRSPDLWNAQEDYCTFSDGPHIIETPAGVFKDCFSIVTPYLSGRTQDWVCKGVGYTAARYDHLGSPFGYETTLLEYKIALP